MRIIFSLPKPTMMFAIFKMRNDQWVKMGEAPNATAAIKTAHAIGGKIRFEKLSGQKAAA